MRLDSNTPVRIIFLFPKNDLTSATFLKNLLSIPLAYIFIHISDKAY